MAQLLFTHMVPVVFKGGNGLVVIHVIRFQWSDNKSPNATYYMKKGKQINLSCPVSLSTSTHACFLEPLRHENHQDYFWFTSLLNKNRYLWRKYFGYPFICAWEFCMGPSSWQTPVQPGQKFPSPRAFGAFAAWWLADSRRLVDMLVFSCKWEALPKSKAGPLQFVGARTGGSM